MGKLTRGKILGARKSMLGLSVMCHRESQEGTFVTAACVGKVLDVVVCYAALVTKVARGLNSNGRHYC